VEAPAERSGRAARVVDEALERLGIDEAVFV
jgi:hypothetical protein